MSKRKVGWYITEENIEFIESMLCDQYDTPSNYVNHVIEQIRSEASSPTSDYLGTEKTLANQDVFHEMLSVLKEIREQGLMRTFGNTDEIDDVEEVRSSDGIDNEVFNYAKAYGNEYVGGLERTIYDKDPDYVWGTDPFRDALYRNKAIQQKWLEDGTHYLKGGVLHEVNPDMNEVT